MHIEEFERIVGVKNVQNDSAQKLAADKPWREAAASDKFIAVVDWSAPEQLRQILRYCAKHDIAIVPRAGGTSLSNSASISTYRDDENYILLRDRREPFFEISREPHYEIFDGSATIRGNVTAKKLEAEQGDWVVPVDLGIGSKGAPDGRCATILGYIATNAAGSGAAFKGRAIDMVQSMTVMMADGKIWNLPSKIAGAPKIEDVAGMGGSTAIILEAEIGLIPRPKARAVAALRVENIGEMYDILEAAKQQCWAELNLFERMNERLLDVVAQGIERVDAQETAQLKAAGKGDFLFIELTSDAAAAPLAAKLEKLLAGRKAIITDDAKYADWLLEYRVVNASTKGSEFAKSSGGKMVAFDISVPAGDVAEFPSKALIAKIQKKFAGVEVFYFGHAAGVEKIDPSGAKGGTALHFNPVLPKELATAENEKWLRDAVFSEVAARGGQIVSEHGIGTKFVAEFEQFQPQQYAEMAAKIAQLDPKNILNRGAICTHAAVLAQVEKVNSVD